MKYTVFGTLLNVSVIYCVCMQVYRCANTSLSTEASCFIQSAKAGWLAKSVWLLYTLGTFHFLALVRLTRCFTYTDFPTNKVLIIRRRSFSQSGTGSKVTRLTRRSNSQNNSTHKAVQLTRRYYSQSVVLTMRFYSQGAYTHMALLLIKRFFSHGALIHKALLLTRRNDSQIADEN